MHRASDGTRKRLVVAATGVFAKVGFQAATTRQICQKAAANSAAVNYHFGGKLGLYKSVIVNAADKQQTRFRDIASLQAPADVVLRQFVTLIVPKLGGEDQLAALIAHEMARPTPGLSTLVAQIMMPRVKFLCGVVAKNIERSEDAEETRLIARSIIAQYVHFTRSRRVLKMLYPTWRMNIRARSAMIDHIVEFSLAGMRA